MTNDDTHAADAARYFADALDETGRLIAGAHCIRCHYDLRGSTPAGVCPECGVPILDKTRLRFASPAWLRRLRRGPAFFLMALAAFIGYVALQNIVTSEYPTEVGQRVRVSQTPNVLYLIGEFAYVLPLLIGVLCFTAHDPTRHVRSERLYPRRLARYLAFGLLVLSVVSTLLGLLVRESPPHWEAVMLCLLYMPAWAIMLILLLHHIVLLMQRIPARWSSRYARVVWWGSIPVLSLYVAFWLVSLAFQDLRMPEPPYAIGASWTSPATTLPTTMPANVPFVTMQPTRYHVFDEEGFVTLVESVPDSIRVVDWSQSGPRFDVSNALCTLGQWPSLAFIIAFLVLLIITRYQIGRALRAAATWHDGVECPACTRQDST